MASRSAASRRVPENDSSIAYVQADGLVIKNLLFDIVSLKIIYAAADHIVNPYGKLT